MARICQHCNGDIEIRNPSGFCDHLYYPEACKVCTAANPTPEQAVIASLNDKIVALEKDISNVTAQLVATSGHNCQLVDDLAARDAEISDLKSTLEAHRLICQVTDKDAKVAEINIELEKWKAGCYSNADNLKESLRRQDMYRLDIIGLNKKISDLEARIVSKDAAIVATDKYFKALAGAWARNEGRLVSEIGTVIRGNEGIDKLCEDAAELVIKNLPAPEVGS